MLFWLLYLVVLRLLPTRERANHKRDVEILVLRRDILDGLIHQYKAAA